MANNVARKIARDVAIDGEWYKSSAGDTIEGVAQEMIDAGMDVTLIIDWLERVIGAIREEYGD